MILFLDLEVSVGTQKLKEIGLIKGDQRYKGTDQSQIKTFAQGAKWVGGHNIVNHDLKILENTANWTEISSLPEPIDTLLLSPLLQPNLKQHKLGKDYLVNELSKPNPLFDADLSRELLFDLAELWKALPQNIQQGYHAILSQQRGFKGFFEWLDWETSQNASFIAEPFPLRTHFWNYDKLLCTHADLDLLQQTHPVELAYVLAIVKTDQPKILTPSWMLGAFPAIQEVFDQLRSRDCGDPHCSYCSQKLNPIEALNQFFGYQGFRAFTGDQGMPLQERVVRSALKDESLLAIFPTGGGKSLTFQMPGLIRGQAKGSLTVVISPLVSLMKDQVDVLFHRFHRNEAVALNSLLSPPEREEVIERMEDGTASLLYLSPESLRSATVLRLLTNRIIDRFVIDEAHCFSAWGQDFRVDYEFIGPYIRMLQERKMDKRRIPISCFTATARPEVVEDIKTYFLQELGLELKEFITRQARSNLQYEVIAAPNKEQKFNSLVEILQENPGPAIIYVTLTKTTEALAEKLKAHHFSTGFFHGKMDPQEKKEVQERFMNDELSVMIATSAFGMGVDKDNVGLVIHYEISSSLENYVQEAGRAGRDKKLQAKCVILFDQSDLDQHFNILQAARISQKEIQQIWRGIQQFKREKITKSALEIARKAGWDEDIHDLETRVKTAVNALEKAGYVERFLNSPQIFADSILIKNFEEGRRKIQQNLSLFHNKPIDAERVLKAIMGQSRRDGETRIDYLADSLGLDSRKVISLINLFKEIGILGDLKDLEVDVNPLNSKYGSLAISRRFTSLEERIFQHFAQYIEKGRKIAISLRELNDQMAEDLPDTSMDGIRRILQIWELHGWIRKTRTQRSELTYHLFFKREKDALRQYIDQKKQLCMDIIRELLLMAETQITASDSSDEKRRISITFSLVSLKQQIETKEMFSQNFPLKLFERSLLYLNHIGAIDLKRGFLVFYNRLNVGLKEQNTRKRYTLEDYQKMKEHYDQRVEQIHIAGEYAKRMLNNYQEALTFTSDYFTLEYADFLRKYFPKSRQKEIRRAMTPEKFEEVFSPLSLEQKAPVTDADSHKIVVAAGPGSGKTMVLVHKMANLILLEDVNPRQLLVLTFSRPASREFRSRLTKLVGGIGRRVDIYTYHAYSFRLIGRMGNLQKSEDVIEKATQAILEGEIPLEMVAAKNVIMLDEFQDVSQTEFDFLQAIRKVAGDPRIVVAGDDDQNIYEFRGSSVEYMHQLVKQEKATSYFLTDNYRSGQGIVDFSNAFMAASFMHKRLKSQTLLKSKRNTAGAVKLLKYDRPGLIESFCKAVAEADLKGTVGVLTATNEEANLIATRLKNLGIPASLVASNRDFKLKNLLELEVFSSQLLKKINPESGWIPNDIWQETRQTLSAQFEHSEDWPLVARIIHTFEQEKKYKYRIDWQEYLANARIEDFYDAEKGRVFVSTMHKIKGKQFDKVFLLLDRFRMRTPSEARVVYVAITRPRDYLEIHTHLSLFDKLEVPGLTQERAQPSEHLSVFSLQCSLSDVVLSHFHQDEIQNRLASLVSGTVLEFAPGERFHRALLPGQWNAMVACFSSRFKQQLDQYFEKGYGIKGLKVGHIVYWWDEQADTKVRVLLPEVELGK